MKGSDLANPYEKDGECDTDQQEEGNRSDVSELTDDSDLYSEDDQDDTYSVRPVAWLLCLFHHLIV